MTAIWLVVSVPVLSEQMTVVQPSVSTEGRLRRLARLTGQEGSPARDREAGSCAAPRPGSCTGHLTGVQTGSGQGACGGCQATCLAHCPELTAPCEPVLLPVCVHRQLRRHTYAHHLEHGVMMVCQLG